MKKIFPPKGTIRRKLLIWMLVLSLCVMVAVSLASYHLALERVESISKQLAAQYSVSLGTTLSTQFELLHDLSNDFIQSGIVQEILSEAQDASKLETLTLQLDRAVSTTLHKSLNAAETFTFIHLYFADGYTYETKDYEFQSFSTYETCLSYFDKTNTEQSESYTAPRWDIAVNKNDNKSYLVYLRYLYDALTMKKVGIVLFGLPVEQIEDLYPSYVNAAYLLTRSGEVLTDSRSSLPENTSMLLGAIQNSNTQENCIIYTDGDGKEKMVSYYPIVTMGGYLIVPFEVYERVRNAEMVQYLHSMLVIGAVMILVVFALATMLSWDLSKSITSLSNFMGRVAQGNPDLRYSSDTQDDVSVLGEGINNMLDQLQQASQQCELDLREKQMLKLELMQQQINPHLLYNTLDAVIYVLRQDRVADATQLLYALSEFFKLSLSKGQKQVRLKEELQLIQYYLDIQRIARKKEIQLEMEIDEALLDYPIMKLSLQPLVENSILHGFDGYCDEGVIQIQAKIDQSDILICVTDDGIGIIDSELAYINEVLQLPERPQEFQHFGLYNINRRIVRAYGKSYGLVVESEVSAYTTVHMRLPLIPSVCEKE